jgi:NarL family two-component system sensor histidine kinase YdfH
MPQRDRAIERPHLSLPEGWLFFAIVSLIVAAGYAWAIREPFLRQEPWRLAAVTLLVAAHIVLIWLSPRLFYRRRELPFYFALQGVLAFAVGLLTPGTWLAIMLYMVLTGIALARLWPNLRAVAAVVAICLALSTYHLVASWGWGALVQLLPTLGIVIAFVVIYVVLFIRQTQARARAQELLEELETAHRQLQVYADRVQALTLDRERQRMAQELHDTLAQGLAGLILQLEAADSHLEEGNGAKAQETVQRAMARARSTLHEARRAIQALRPAVLEEGDLVHALGQEVETFEGTTGIEVTFQVDAGPLRVPPAAAQDILRIVQESLTNVARHAQATHVQVRLQCGDEGLRVVVQDDGQGFDPDRAREQARSYGLRGMRARASHIGGALRVESAPGAGTTVTLEMETP